MISKQEIKRLRTEADKQIKEERALVAAMSPEEKAKLVGKANRFHKKAQSSISTKEDDKPLKRKVKKKK